MKIINFSHPLTKNQIAQIEQITQISITEVIEIKTQFDHLQSFSQQVETLINSVNLSSTEWQTTPLLINLPSLNIIAALLLADLHGRMGYFPSILRLRPIDGIGLPQFEVAEIINLQNIREVARKNR
jgi:hypothetical protein